MRITLLLTLALFAAACGESATTTTAPSSADSSGPTDTTTTATTESTVTTTPVPVAEVAGFVIGDPPEGYRATNADGRHALSEVSYNDRGCGNTSDWYAQVRVTDEFDFFEGRPGDHDPHFLSDGTEVEILDLWDDGRPYGYGASWELGDGRWVTIRYDEAFSVDELRAGIDSLEPIDADEWDRLSRALSIDTHVGRVDEGADDVTVDLGDLAGAPASVTFHRPGDYPLGDDDCRQACYSLVHSGVTIPTECATFPLVLRVDGGIVLASLLDSLVETVWIDAGRGVVVADDAQREAASISVPGMPSRFFATALPADWCHFVVSTPDADFGTGLGEGGIPSLRADSAGCDFDVECLDRPAATTTTAPEDGD